MSGSGTASLFSAAASDVGEIPMLHCALCPPPGELAWAALQEVSFGDLAMVDPPFLGGGRRHQHQMNSICHDRV